MLGAELIIENIKETFDGQFTAARYRKLSEGFDLNQLRGSDLVIVPASLRATAVGVRAQSRPDGSITILDEYIAVFLLERKTESRAKTLQTLLSAISNTPKLGITVSKVELDPAFILKGIFGKDQTVDVELYAIWIRAETLVTTNKQDCEICYDDC